MPKLSVVLTERVTEAQVRERQGGMVELEVIKRQVLQQQTALI